MSDDAAQYSATHAYRLSYMCYVQVDMKIMYYELIKMLMEHDKQQQSEEEYNVTR